MLFNPSLNKQAQEVGYILQENNQIISPTNLSQLNNAPLSRVSFHTA